MLGKNKLSGKSSYIRIPSGTELKDVLKILVSTYNDKYEFVDTRDDFYAFLSNGNCIQVQFGESYVIKDIVNSRYIYFVNHGDILITTSDSYDKNENICWQKNIPKGYITQSDTYLDSSDKTHATMKYTNEKIPTIFFNSMKYNKNSDIYIVNNGQSFSIFCRTDGVNIYKKKDGQESYIIYDTSDKYHTENKLVSCIYSSGSTFRFLCINTTTMKGIDVWYNGEYYSQGHGYCGLIYVPADTYDNDKSGYYFEYADNPHTEFTSHSDLIHKYLLEPINRMHSFYPPTEIKKDRPDNNDYIKNYLFDDNFIGFCKSSMDIYIYYDSIPKYNQTIFNKNNTIGNHLDMNTYSGLRSTLNNGSIALPNITYILRQPFVLKDMSAVMESTFMYMVDMSDKSNGDICEYIDNYGNKIKLICFMTYQSVTNLFSNSNNPKQLGIGIRLE